MYSQFWQRKLRDNKEIEFPDKLCVAIADITHDFSFAYMQEAFVAALLALASNLQHLYLMGPRDQLMPPAGLNVLEDVPKLQALHLYIQEDSPWQQDALCPLSGLSRLTSLSLETDSSETEHVSHRGSYEEGALSREITAGWCVFCPGEGGSEARPDPGGFHHRDPWSPSPHLRGQG